MKKIKHEELIATERFYSQGLLTEKEIDQAIEAVLKKVNRNMAKLGHLFPTPATSNNAYGSIKNIEWTTGFWTGILWLCYEVTGDEKYRELADVHVDDFLERLNRILKSITTI